MSQFLKPVISIVISLQIPVTFEVIREGTTCC